MKILYIVPFFYPVKGGAENHIYYLAKELVKKGHDVHVITSNLDRNSLIKKEFEIIDGIKIYRLKSYFRISNFVSFFPAVFTKINKFDYDILHIHGFRHPHNLIVFLTKKPKLITPHWPEYPSKVRGSFLDFLTKLFDLFLAKIIFRNCDYICAVNKLEIDWYKKKYGITESKIKLIPNGIPKDFFKKGNPNFLRNKYHIPKGSLIVTSLSRLHQSKGLDLIIKVAQYFPNTYFFIAGSRAGYETYLHKLIKSKNLNNVIIIEELEEKLKLDYLSSSDIFIHPSYYDAFGISILEAFSQKNAVIASNAGGIPWVIEGAGLLFKTGSEKDLKFKLTILINDKKYRKELSKKGYERAQQFVWEDLAVDLEGLYKSLL